MRGGNEKLQFTNKSLPDANIGAKRGNPGADAVQQRRGRPHPVLSKLAEIIEKRRDYTFIAVASAAAFVRAGALWARRRDVNDIENPDLILE